MGDTLGWEPGVRQCARLHPGGGTEAPGSEWRVLAEGGPQPGSEDIALCLPMLCPRSAAWCP